MSKKVCLDCGHGGKDPGAVNGTRTEKADVLRLGLKVRDLLTAAGINVVLTRTADESVSINDRCKIANAAKCDYFLSIHRNAATPDAAGNEIWVHSQAVAHVVDKAQKILNAVCAVAGKNRGVKKGAAGNYTDYGVNRDTDMPSALLELGFITSDTDNKYFDTHFDAYAKAIAKGVCAALGVDYKDPQPAPTKPSTGGKIEKGDIVHFAGGKVYASSTATAATSTRGASKCKVTATAPGAKHPFHCISEDGKGVYGWVDAAAVGAASSGNPAPADPYAAGRKIALKEAPLYASATTGQVSSRISGSYYLYDGKSFSGRYRITPRADMVGKTPVGSNVTGYVNKSDIR